MTRIEPPTIEEDTALATVGIPVPATSNGAAPRPQSGFASNVLKLVSGSTFAQAVTALTAPFIARLFAPEAFGAAALFVALVGLISAVVGMRYELSIVLPEKDEEAANTAMVSLCFVVVISSITAVLIGLLGHPLLVLLRATELQPVLWLVPVNVIIFGVSSALMYWNIRKKRFGIQGIAQVVGVLFFVAMQIVWGLKGYRSAKVIIVATVLSTFISSVILGLQACSDSGSLFVRVKVSGMLDALKRYSSFPKFSTASAALNNLGWQIPTFMLSAYFSTTVVGYYSLGNKLLRLPVGLIGANIATVFFQHASEAHRSGALHAAVDKIFHYLIKLFLFPTLLLTLVGKDVFVLIFGQRWGEAGVYTQILSIYVLFWFMAVPLGITLNVLEKQAVELRIIVMVLLARIAALIVGGSTGSARITLGLFAIAGVAMYGYYCLVVFRHCGISYQRIGRLLAGELRLFVPAGMVLGMLMLFHVAPIVTVATSAVALLLYYAYWIYCDPVARDAFFAWSKNMSPAWIFSQAPKLSS
ncbi:MAG: lipopolysaccharide biosynthesis protein [Acidobacteriia bacterium]|nr:lipopolysaccharide biosynthesis protein [Terriglobia bacterium]